MTAAKRVAASPDKLALYRRLLENVEGANARSNFGSAFTAVIGNIRSNQRAGQRRIADPERRGDAGKAGRHPIV
jgi:hypothetical protein